MSESNGSANEAYKPHWSEDELLRQHLRASKGGAHG